MLELNHLTVFKCVQVHICKSTHLYMCKSTHFYTFVKVHICTCTCIPKVYNLFHKDFNHIYK